MRRVLVLIVVILFIICCTVYEVGTDKHPILDNQKVDAFTDNEQGKVNESEADDGVRAGGEQNSSKEPVIQIDKHLNTRILEEKELKIDNKPILGLKYAEVIKVWGKPNEIKKVKVYFSATENPYYCYIMKYDGIDIEMYPVEINISVQDTESFRFDITSSKYDFYGVKIGTSLSDYMKTLENKDVFKVKEILECTNEERIPFQYRKLLTTLKEGNYYNDYEKAVYEQVVVNGVPHGAVILLIADKISRIVYGLPNAD